MDKLLKPYRNRIKELRKNIELVKEFKRVATQQPEDRFRGNSVDSGSAFYGVGSHTFSSGETIPLGVLALHEREDVQVYYKCRLFSTGASVLLIKEEYDGKPELTTTRIFGLLMVGVNYIGFISEDFGKLDEERNYPKGLEKLFESDLGHVCFTNRWYREEDKEQKYFAVDFHTTFPREEYRQRTYRYGIEESLDQFVIKVG